ncbi:12332_t:CDS:2, partial [Cetraspora pellucida]
MSTIMSWQGIVHGHCPPIFNFVPTMSRTSDVNMRTMSSTAQVKNKVTTSVSYVTTTPNPSSSNQPICHTIRNDESTFTVTDLKCLSLTPKFQQSKFCSSNIKIFTDSSTRLKQMAIVTILVILSPTIVTIIRIMTRMNVLLDVFLNEKKTAIKKELYKKSLASCH